MRRDLRNILKNLAAIIIPWTVFINSADAQLPSANFTASPTSGCSPLVVSFTDQSNGSPTLWNWDFGNGATSTLQNPTTTYFLSGTYTVTLTVTNATGSNTLTRTQYITVYEPPVVDFSGLPLSGCFPLRTQFTDLSTPGAGNTNVTWLWDFGNGTQSSLQNPLIAFTTAGNFTISLRVTNDKGCSKIASKPNYIQVAPGVTANFNHTNAVACRPPSIINFTDSSTGPGILSYSWNFGDGGTSNAQNPSHTYNTGGTFVVTLAVTSSNGCTDTIRHNISILNTITAITAPDTVCINTPVNFINASVPPPVSSSWDFGDGNTSTAVNPVNTFGSAGLYNVKLVSTYSNCIDSVTRPILVVAKPVANFTAPITSRCEPDLTVNFQDNSTGALSWQWNFGDGGTSTQQNPSHTYTTYGNFDVTLIVTNFAGCTDTLRRPGFVNINRAQIRIPLLPARGCIPYPITLSANITAVDAVTSYLWDFGDGFTSNSPTPSHTYTVQGSYTVKLFITTSTGCTDSLVVPGGVRVGTHPAPNFSASPLISCAYQPVNFTDLTPAPVDEWLWYFGDGATSPLQNPSHAYADTGYFSVTLVAYNSGCPDSITFQNYVYIQAPIARFSHAANCANQLQFTFLDQSTGPVTTWLWDFGDGNTSNAQNPSHTYASFGDYVVTLTVSNNNCTHSSSQTIHALNINPDFVASPAIACKPANVLFGPQGFPLGNIVSYHWDFGNGDSTTTPSAAVGYTYNNTGYYTITLITTDVNGCLDTIVKPNYVRINGPTANFAAAVTSGCSSSAFVFSDSSLTDGLNPIVNWEWDFGDGVIQNFSGPPFQHVYNAVDTFTVKLKITDAAGCTDSLTFANYILTSDPRAQFRTDTLTCPGATVNFINESPAVNPTSLWDFGDGGTATTTNATHVYAATGDYPVILQITDQYNCVVRDTQNVHVERPVAAFTVNDSVSSCIPFAVNFTNTSQYFTSLSWNFGQGGTSAQPNPIVYYSIPGTYIVKLYATSPGGCIDSAQRTITLYDTAGSYINYAPLAGCKPLQVTLNAFTQGPGTYIWDYGDGTVDSTTVPNVTHIYDAFGDFIPKVILKDPAGCLIPITGPDTLRIVGADAKFGFDNRQFCDSGFVNFTDSSTFNDPITQYTWDFGDGTILTGVQHPTHEYLNPGLYTVNLMIQTLSGCRDTLMLPDTIRVIRSPSIDINGDTVVCVNEPMLLNGIFVFPDTSAVNWGWTFPNGNTSNQQNPAQQIYGAAGNYIVTAIAINSSGCRDTTYQNITVHPLPTVTMPGTITMQVGFPVLIPATYSSGVQTYAWSPPATLSCADCPQPIADPKSNTRYTVSFTDSNSCRNSSFIDIVVICRNANVFVPNTFSPNGDGMNDKFYPRGRGIDRAKVMRIFNRWGEVIFEAQNFEINDPNFGWDGTYKGNKQQAGVYIYQVEFYCDNGDLIRLEGNIALIL